jgi:hypothetical protein
MYHLVHQMCQPPFGRACRRWPKQLLAQRPHADNCKMAATMLFLVLASLPHNLWA